MVESGLIAEGSLNGLLNGTHFNRCKTLHPVIALTFRVLHFKEFLKEYNASNHVFKLDPLEVLEILERDTGFDTTDVTLFELSDLLERYDTYSQQTLNGKHGNTAKYVLQYTTLVELYQLFERGIRTTV